VPSGDHAGLIDSEGCRVRRRRVSLPSASHIDQKPLSPCAGSPLHTKAILEPSAEKAGEVATPGNAVNGMQTVSAPALRTLRPSSHRKARMAARAKTEMARTPAAIFNHVWRERKPRSGSTVTIGTTGCTGGSNSPMNRYPSPPWRVSTKRGPRPNHQHPRILLTAVFRL
jgi:hypothetical protein